MGVRRRWIGVAVALACGCGDDAVTRARVRVQVEFPATWAQRAAGGVEVTVIAGAASTRAVTDARGEASFDAPDGPWSLRASRALTADETAALTGHARAVTVDAEVSVPAGGAAPERITLRAPRLGGLVIRELYYAGSPGVGEAHYFSDQFVEVFNNSTETQWLDGLCVADLHGPAGEINPGTAPTPFGGDESAVVAESVWQVPGSGREHPLAPGEAAVLAHDGTNHAPMSPLDLSDADWESYNERTDMRDVDHPTVPNLTRVVFNGGLDWLLPVFGGSVVLFRIDDTASLERVAVRGFSGRRVRVPAAVVLDAVDALMDGESARYKRVPASLDRGFAHVGGTYTGESLRRRVVARVAGRVVVQDTDDSAEDFEVVATPTPRGASGP